MAGASSVVIGIGNPYRSDDGLGIMVARLVRRVQPDDCAVWESGGEGTELMVLWEGARQVIVVDAVRAVAPPGTVFRMDAVRDRVPGSLFSCSTHAFSVAGAIEMSRALGTLPPCVTVYGVAGAVFTTGTELTDEVAAAGRRVAVRIVGDLSAEAQRSETEGVERTHA